MNLSKSLIHAFDEIDLKQKCEEAFKKEYILKEPEFMWGYDPKTAAGKGQYFEFLVTGEKLRDGTEPYPLTIKNGNLNADYKRIKNRAEVCKKMLKEKNIIIKETGKVLNHKYKNTNIKGILDIFGEYKKQNTVIDLKFSGLIGNKWEKYGWYPDELNPFHKLQPRVYKWLCWKEKNIIDVPFYYIIFGQKQTDMLFLEMCYDSKDEFFEDMKELEKKFDYVLESINIKEDVIGWEATNDFKECVNCPAENCENRLDYVKKQKVKLNI